MYKNPSLSLCCSYTVLSIAAVGGMEPLTNRKIAFSAGSFRRFRITYTNWPQVKSEGTKYFFLSISCFQTGKSRNGINFRMESTNFNVRHNQLTSMLLFSIFSQITVCRRNKRRDDYHCAYKIFDGYYDSPGIRSGYLWRTRSDSAFRCSKVCSALNFMIIFWMICYKWLLWWTGALSLAGCRLCRRAFPGFWWN